nr:hypothetical protein [uncultured Clostridium sp.]
MKKPIVIFLAALMVVCCLTGCRTTSRKQIRPLFSHVSAQTFLV